jgi:hypothetical protein
MESMCQAARSVKLQPNEAMSYLLIDGNRLPKVNLLLSFHALECLHFSSSFDSVEMNRTYRQKHKR